MIDTKTSVTTAWAPAKVNLYLHVGQPLEDGRHPLDSLVQFADVRAADRISARPARELSLKIEGTYSKGLKADGENLIMRAAALLRQAVDRYDLGASLNLQKELPLASGIGGGSADAAAAMLILNQYWNIGFSEEALQTLAAELGADVPACMTGHAAIMRGTGEALTPVDSIDLPVLLVNPGVKLSTEAVYKKFDAMGLGRGFVERQMPDPADGVEVFARALHRFSNDLEEPAIALCSQIKDVLGLIGETDDVLLTRMSGSGATCFGIYKTFEEAERAGRYIAKRKRRWWVQPTILSGVR